MRFAFAILIALFALSGCVDYGPSQVAPLNAISVRTAFDDVADGLTDFRNKVDAPDPATGEPHKMGIVVCRIIVHFNIAASASQTSGGGATLAAPIEAFKVSANYQALDAATASRGNSVLVDLGGLNNDLCSTYEKPSDMYPPPASTSQSKSDQSNTQGSNNNQGGNGSDQNTQVGSQTGSQGNKNSPTNTPPKQTTATVNSYLAMLEDKCKKGDKVACQDIDNTVMSLHIPISQGMPLLTQ